MKSKSMLLLGFWAGILVCLLTPILLLAMGAINVGADVKPGLIERSLAPWGRDRSVATRALKEKNPYGGEPSAIATGLDHYRENCLMCHGAPEIAGAELSQGLNPPAPSLDKGGKGRPDGELFWVIKHGLRMTAMPAFGPTHTDEEIWKIVAFIRHLPELTAPERAALQPEDGANEHHHGAETSAVPDKTGQPVQPDHHGTP